MNYAKKSSLSLNVKKDVRSSIKAYPIEGKKFIFLGGTAFILLLSLLTGIWGIKGQKRPQLSQEVLKYQPSVERYAQEYGVSDYMDYLLAIMQVESGGNGQDIMQCSESLGLSPNSLDPEESMEQACKYFSELVDTAKRLECDMKSVIQAYNYGIGYLFYVAEHGHRHTSELAEQFAEVYSEGIKVEYNNPVAEQKNGGWRYQYGNMFYVELIEPYL